MAIDYNKLNSLSNEAAQLQQAIDNFDAGGRITSMTVSGPVDDQMMRMPVNIMTSQIEYPSQMVTAIKAALNERYHVVSAELDQVIKTR